MVMCKNQQWKDCAVKYLPILNTILIVVGIYWALCIDENTKLKDLHVCEDIIYEDMTDD